MGPGESLLHWVGFELLTKRRRNIGGF